MKWQPFLKPPFLRKFDLLSFTLHSLLTQIDLLRHGETEHRNRYCGSTNHPLTPLGWQQLWHAVNEPEKNSVPWNVIVTSPLQRCAAFAAELGRHQNIPVIEERRFQEIHFGDWENLYSAEIMQNDASTLMRFWQNPLIVTPPNAESLIEFNKRILSAWRELLDQYQQKKILCISHGGVMRIILCHIHHKPLENLLKFKINHADRYSISIPMFSGDPTVSYHPCNV